MKNKFIYFCIILTTFFIGIFNVNAKVKKAEEIEKFPTRNNDAVECWYKLDIGSTNSIFNVVVISGNSTMKRTLTYRDENNNEVLTCDDSMTYMASCKALNSVVKISKDGKDKKELENYKCPTFYYDNEKFDKSNPIVSSTKKIDEETKPEDSKGFCYYKKEEATLPRLFNYEWKFTDEELDSSWIKTDIKTYEECDSTYKKKTTDGSIFSTSENSGRCILCKSSNKPVWLVASFEEIPSKYTNGDDIINQYCAGKGFEELNISNKTACGKYGKGSGGDQDTTDKSCGNGAIKNISPMFIKITSTIFTVIQIGVPIILIILGMIDFGKAALAQKEDEIKKGQKIFISRLIAAILVFLVVLIVKTAIRFVNEENSSKIISCIDCFINGDCKG